MFKTSNFCHIASNNRNQTKAGVFVYRTTDNLETVSTSGYFNERIVDIQLHDFIIHEQIDASDKTKIKRNLLCVTERTTDNVKAQQVIGDWEEDIAQYIEDTFVKKDGSSIMSGPLKFSAGSMRGAISGGLNGLTFFKIDSGGNMTQIAHLSDTQFVPVSDNTMDLGTASRKLKTVYANNLNNGHNIAIPVTNSDDTVGLKSQIDDAANSGEQLYTTGVWYAKMYAASTVPTGAEYEGRNYADFSQVDNNDNPIIVIYTYTSGAWTETTTITPPLNHNGYMTITSKIWDIAEQAGQQGGLVLWAHNQKTFTPYPRIVSFDSINVTGESTVAMPNSPVGGQIVNVDYVTDHADPLKYATNCITEIPQDIKLELNAGTLTLKAGSKVYVPNGVDTFDAVTTTSDIIVPGWAAPVQAMLCINPSTSEAVYVWREQQYSGATAPTSAQKEIWYDTANNFVKVTEDTGVTWTSGLSLPIALITSSGSSGGSIWISIDQVFNGFGYIGSTVFALPGVKGLIPNGRNTDGTLNNTVTNDYNTVKTVQVNTSTAKIGMYVNGGLGSQTNGFELNEQENFNYDTGVLTEALQVANVVVDSNSLITAFSSKTVFHAVDYNDSEYIAHCAMPSSTTIPFTLPASGSSYVAPTDGYLKVVINCTAGGYLNLDGNYWHVGSNGGYIGGTIPSRKGKSLLIQYSNYVETIQCVFIPSIGAK